MPSVYKNILVEHRELPDGREEEVPLSDEVQELVHNYWIDNTPKELIPLAKFEDGARYLSESQEDFQKEIDQFLSDISADYFVFLSESFKQEASNLIKQTLTKAKFQMPTTLWKTNPNPQEGKAIIEINAPISIEEFEGDFRQAVSALSEEAFVNYSDNPLERIRIENEIFEDKRSRGKSTKQEKDKFEQLRNKRRANIEKVSDEEEVLYQEQKKQINERSVFRDNIGNRYTDWCIEWDLLLKRLLDARLASTANSMIVDEFKYQLVLDWLQAHGREVNEIYNSVAELIKEHISTEEQKEDFFRVVNEINLTKMNRRIQESWIRLYPES